jgi:hypothetical protein
MPTPKKLIEGDKKTTERLSQCIAILPIKQKFLTKLLRRLNKLTGY